MTDARTLLTERLAQLQQRHAKLDAHLTNADRDVPTDWDDRAQVLENDVVMEGIDAVTLNEISHIRAALDRLDAGTYGECASCGGTIPAGRLAAIPTATQCVDCAS
ncbi:MAG: TraR/DksA family transcriptional regulator [Deltaproteobacteria bacterium]|nr:MAG: TraR/DksA family transcriptional regulator [Deltaproteobacteria bacterium]